MIHTIANTRSLIDRLKGQKSHISKQAKESKAKYISAVRDLQSTEKAQALIQKAAAMTQDQLKYYITDLGSMALEAVFGDGMKLDLIFEEKRGKTEARLAFISSEGHTTNPLDEDSGGASDIAAFALRCSLWTMKRPRTRALMVMDEPFKNINDPTRQMQEKAAEMVKTVSEKLGIQFLIVTMLPELEEVADKIFKIE
jgi:DNA repair exonuclease SbcCD ATPase subunit